jgi:hypothetical protein
MGETSAPCYPFCHEKSLSSHNVRDEIGMSKGDEAIIRVVEKVQCRGHFTGGICPNLGGAALFVLSHRYSGYGQQGPGRQH